MTYAIHFTWPDGTDDSFIVQGCNDAETRAEVMSFFESRGLDPYEANAWTEELD